MASCFSNRFSSKKVASLLKNLTEQDQFYHQYLMIKRRLIMGFWSTSLYGNDMTLDVRDNLDDLLKNGVSPQNIYQ